MAGSNARAMADMRGQSVEPVILSVSATSCLSSAVPKAGRLQVAVTLPRVVNPGSVANACRCCSTVVDLYHSKACLWRRCQVDSGIDMR